MCCPDKLPQPCGLRPSCRNCTTACQVGPFVLRTGSAKDVRDGVTGASLLAGKPVHAPVECGQCECDQDEADDDLPCDDGHDAPTRVRTKPVVSRRARPFARRSTTDPAGSS